VIDGKVRFYNDQGSLNLINRQQAVAEVGKAPVPTASFNANKHFCSGVFIILPCSTCTTCH